MDDRPTKRAKGVEDVATKAARIEGKVAYAADEIDRLRERIEELDDEQTGGTSDADSRDGAKPVAP